VVVVMAGAGMGIIMVVAVSGRVGMVGVGDGFSGRGICGW
jgi:hypothetical protein